MLRKISCEEKPVFYRDTAPVLDFYCDVSKSKSENFAFRKRLQIYNITVYADGIVLPVLRNRIQ
jgi:hypothetical protein